MHCQEQRETRTKKNSENNLPMFRLNAPVVINDRGESDHLLFIYAELNWEATESSYIQSCTEFDPASVWTDSSNETLI